MRNRAEWVSIAILVSSLYIATRFIYGHLVSLNRGEQKTATIVTEVKRMGYPSDDFDLQRFNIIDKIGGGRSLYGKYVFNNIDQSSLEKFYKSSLIKNGWINKDGRYIKGPLLMNMNVENNIVGFIVSVD